MKVNLNGQIIEEKEALLSADNRAFSYGDAVFETIRIFDGQIVFWDLHWRRLLKGFKYLKYQQPDDIDFYKKEIQKLCGNQGDWRVRLTVFRKSGGLYTPATNQTHFLIKAEGLKGNSFELNEQGLKIDVCNTITIPRSPLSNLKTANSLPYVLAALFKKEQGLDDCVLLNEKSQVVEASSSNLFILKNGVLLTPKLKSGCKDGVMRRVIARVAHQLGIPFFKKVIYPADLLKADEIWLTNAIRGLQWVGELEGRKYAKEEAVKFIKGLNEKVKENSIKKGK